MESFPNERATGQRFEWENTEPFSNEKRAVCFSFETGADYSILQNAFYNAIQTAT